MKSSPTATWAATFAFTVAVGCGESSAPLATCPPEPPVEGHGAECTSDAECRSYLVCAESACAYPPTMRGESADATVTFQDSSAVMSVEVASTEGERERGLSFRPCMRDGWGMLFEFPSEDEASLWMKNTVIPLDAVFLDSELVVVDIVEGMQPETETLHTSSEPSKYALEVKSGSVRLLGLSRGDSAEVQPL